MNEIDPNLSIPVYLQIRNYILEKINTSVYPSGSRIPSERDLAKYFKVNRITVRKALHSLMQEGIIYSQTGKGYYVHRPRIDQELGVLTSFSEEMLQRGAVSSNKVIIAEIQPAMLEMAEALQISPGAEIVILQRLRLVDNEPIALETAHLPHKLCPGILEHHDFNKESLYKVLRHDYKHPLIWAKQKIQSRLPTPTEQELVGINHLSPVLSITRTTYTQNDKPIEFVRSIYRGDQYELGVILR